MKRRPPDPFIVCHSESTWPREKRTKGQGKIGRAYKFLGPTTLTRKKNGKMHYSGLVTFHGGNAANPY